MNKQQLTGKSWKRGLPVEFPSGFGVLIVPEQDVNGVVIVMAEGGEYRRISANAINPIKSDRDRLIDIIVSCGNLSDGALADAILAAGFKAPGIKDA